MNFINSSFMPCVRVRVCLACGVRNSDTDKVRILVRHPISQFFNHMKEEENKQNLTRIPFQILLCA